MSRTKSSEECIAEVEADRDRLREALVRARIDVWQLTGCAGGSPALDMIDDALSATGQQEHPDTDAIEPPLPIRTMRERPSPSPGLFRGEHPDTVKSELYYIQNANQVCGNSAMWWGPNRGGYTSNLGQAGQYTAAECDGICGDKDRRDIARKVSDMDALAQRHVDVQDIRSAIDALKGAERE